MKRPREQDSRNNTWTWLCLLCDFSPLTICSFIAMNVHCSACVLGLSGLLQSSSTDLARSQHAMNTYRRQTHPKSPDPPLSSQIWLFCSLPICFMHTHTQTYSSCLCSSYFSFKTFWELTRAFLFIFFNLDPLISYSIFSSFPELCYPLIPPSSGILSFFCPSPSFLQPSLNSRETESWNMYLIILKIKLIQVWNKYPEKICNAQRLLLHHSWDLIAYSVMINLKLKHVFF